MARRLDDLPRNSIGALMGSRPAAESFEAERLRERLAERLADRTSAPTRVGRFEVGRKLGEGAFGAVYAAFDPQLGRRVAVKLLHRSVRSARLETEARVLASLSDPGIVEIYDVGVDSERDRPFIVMELLPGGTVAQWAARSRRDRAEVLRLFDEVARGLSAAHAAGIVHRDVKPSNILVGPNDVPKLTDFGLAAVSDDATRAAPAGTRAYMAPEVAAGLAASERSDQYGWWVSLHEILVGTRPKDGVPDPSLPLRLRRVVARGLAADPSARYASMDEARAALLDERSWGGWRAWGLASALVGVLALASGLAATGGDVTVGTARRGLDGLLAFEARSRTQRARTLEVAGDYDAVIHELQRGFFAGRRSPGEPWAAHAALHLMSTLGLKLMRYDDALHWSRMARSAIDRLEPRQPRLELTWARLTAVIEGLAGDPEAAVARLLAAVAEAKVELGSDDTDLGRLESNLGSMLMQTGRPEDARPHFDEALRIAELRFGPDHPEVALALKNRGLVDPESAAADYARALAILLATHGSEHPEVAATHHDLASIALDAGDAEGALAHVQRADEAWRAAFGPVHPDVALAAYTTSRAYAALERWDDARAKVDLAIDVHERSVGLDDPGLVPFLAERAALDLAQGQYDDARRFGTRALALARAHDHPQRVWALAHLGEAWLGLGHPDRAEALLDEAVVEASRHPHDAPDPARLARLLEQARTQGGPGQRRRGTR